MTMKNLSHRFVLIVLSVMSWSFAASAVEVPGQVFYKMPTGDLVFRDVTLDVPPMGRGKVIFKSEHYNIESHGFKTIKSHGKITFAVVFLNPPGAPANTAMALVGSYIRGSNHVMYFGDVYAKQYEAGATSEDMAKLLEGAFDASTSREDNSQDEHPWTFAGGFRFEAPCGNAN